MSGTTSLSFLTRSLTDFALHDVQEPHLTLNSESSAWVRSPGFAPSVDAMIQSEHMGPRAGAAATSGRLTGFEMETQLHDNWCWAAVSVSVAKFLNAASPWSQCSIATDQLGQDCCEGFTKEDCDKVWYLDSPLQAIGAYQDQKSGETPFDQTAEFIDDGLPVCCYILWDGGPAGHFIAIGGWTNSASGAQYVDVYDPLYGSKQIVYDDLVQNYKGQGVWSHSFYTQRQIA